MTSQTDNNVSMRLCHDIDIAHCSNASDVMEEKEPSLASPEDSGLISPEVGRIVEITLAVFINGSLSCVGLVTNMINMVVFAKHGFRDSVTISLMALAVADLLGLACMLNMCVCFGLMQFATFTVIDPLALVYVAGSWPHAMFTRMSTWITVYICVERFLCVYVPLKVRSFITAKKTSAYILLISGLMVACYANIYATFGVEWRFDPRVNATRLMLWVSSNRREMENISGVMNGSILPAVSLTIIIICTCAMVSSLNSSSSWREQHAGLSQTKHSQTGSSQDAAASQRSVADSGKNMPERRVARMVIVIALICVMCTVPELTINIVRRFFPDLDANRRYRYTNVIMYYAKYTIQNVNASVNIAIYYRMSSRYRQTLRSMLCLDSNSVSEKKGVVKAIKQEKIVRQS
ncbi:galanin-like G-protein coupled receptor npr-9 [Aplysia californica]|uniref:Galanin-like G-protein coupled receptor npr-9 n=1 Tax=Aplysia californica TaxID=6500 RepID=A0ABM0K0Z9_APLCA|nr:galanin-like G-protein coupled receptor npr-9 [Aplysia californica]